MPQQLLGCFDFFFLSLLKKTPPGHLRVIFLDRDEVPRGGKKEEDGVLQ